MNSRRSHCRSLVLLVAATLTLTACASSRLKDDQLPAAGTLLKHYILVHEDGHAFNPLGRRDVLFGLGDDRQPVSVREDEPCGVRLFADQAAKSDVLDERVAEHVVEGLDAEARAVAEDNKKCRDKQCERPLRILIFVHGGMNGYRDDFKRMTKLLEFELENPKVTARLGGATYYPVFINWNAALGDSIADDLFFIRFGARAHPAVGIATSPLVIVSRIASSVFGAPVAWMHTINNYWDGRKDDHFGTSEERMTADGLAADVSSNILFFLPRALSTPVVEAFGTPAWNVMKRRAQLATAQRLPRNNCASEGAARTLLKTIQARLTPANAAGHEIEPRWTVDGMQVPAEITMVGHSMGAIIVNRLLAAVHPLRVARVVYLAPAAGIDDFEGFLLPYLAHHPNTRFTLFSLSRRNEAYESNYYVEPRGTLLAWIDTMFERGWTVGQMTHGRVTNVLTYYSLDPGAAAIEDVWRKLPLRSADVDPPIPGERIEAYVARNVPAAPKKHGDFDEPLVLRDVLCHVDRAAFKSGVCPEPRPRTANAEPGSAKPTDR